MYRSLLIYNSQQKYEPIWLEYLEGTGTQWINTGIEPSYDIDCSVTFSDTTTSHSYYYFIIGGGTSYQIATRTSANNYYASFYNSNGNLKIFDGNNGKNVVKILNRHLIVNGTDNGLLSINTSPSFSDYLYLFNGRNNQNNSVGKIKIHSCQLYSGSILLRDFRPCLHPISLKPAMYDMVEKKYYYNQGTGEFSYNITFETLDYLQSTGTQYIDTGILVGNVNSYKTKASVVTFTDGWNKMVFGTSETSATNLFGARYTGYWYGAEGVLSYTNDSDIEFNTTHTSSGGETFSSGTIENVPMTFTSTSPFTLNPTLNINLFGQPNGVSSKRNMSGKIWYFIGSKDGIKVVDMIPVKKTDGTICMYDFISGEYKTNSGTGTFTGYPI